MNHAMKKYLFYIFVILLFLAGIGLLLYPTISDYVNSVHQARKISNYTESVTQLEQDIYAQLWKDAMEYNRSLPTGSDQPILSGSHRESYPSLLDVNGSGILGYIEIPSIQCSLPICHGVDPDVLKTAVGHMEGTSLPTGGETTHCVLSAHRGLPSAKLFTDLDQVEKGDLFMLQVLDKTLTYEVDQILIVEPHELDALAIIEGEDLCTLVTCTPYGVNSHRLLVRGHRIEFPETAPAVHITTDAMQIHPALVISAAAFPMLLIFLVVLSASRKKNHR